MDWNTYHQHRKEEKSRKLTRCSSQFDEEIRDQFELNTYLFLLLIKVVDDHSNKQIQGEEGANNDEEDKEEVHVDVDFFYGLLSQLEDIKEIMQDLLVKRLGTFFLMTKTRIFLGIAWFFLMKTRR